MVSNRGRSCRSPGRGIDHCVVGALAECGPLAVALERDTDRLLKSQPGRQHRLDDGLVRSQAPEFRVDLGELPDSFDGRRDRRGFDGHVPLISDVRSHRVQPAASSQKYNYPTIIVTALGTNPRGGARQQKLEAIERSVTTRLGHRRVAADLM